MKRKVKSIVSSVTAFIFLFTQLIPVAPAWISAKPLPQEVKVSSGFQISVPPDLGRIGDLAFGEGPLVIHLQTAHGNYEAQKKIEALLHHLRKHYGFKLLLLEGSAFKLQPEILNFFPEERELTREIADRLTKKALVKGPELFLLDAPDAEAYGIEELESYRKNRESFKSVLLEEKNTRTFLEQMDLGIERLTGPYLGKDLRSFLKRLQAFERNQIPLLSWLSSLKLEADKHLELDLTRPAEQIDWPMLLRVQKLQEIEERLDLGAFEKERKKFLKGIDSASLGSLPRNDFERIRDLLSSPVTRHALPDPETGLLFEQMVSHLPENFNYKAYPNVNLFIGHLILQSELKAERLFKEITRLQDEIQSKLARIPEEKAIISLLKDHRLLQKLFALELTPEDYEAIKGREEAFRPSRLAKRFLEANRSKRVKDVQFIHTKEIDRLFEKALTFYQGVKGRDGEMLLNVVRRLQETGQDKAIIVTGGFHSAPFRTFFESKGYSYVSITPNLSQVEGKEAYLESILQSEPNLFTSSTMEDVAFSLTPGQIQAHGKDPVHLAGEVIETEIEVLTQEGRLDRIEAVNSTRHAKEFGYKLHYPVKGTDGAAALEIEYELTGASRSEARSLKLTEVYRNADDHGAYIRLALSEVGGWTNEVFLYRDKKRAVVTRKSRPKSEKEPLDVHTFTVSLQGNPPLADVTLRLGKVTDPGTDKEKGKVEWESSFTNQKKLGRGFRTLESVQDEMRDFSRWAADLLHEIQQKVRESSELTDEENRVITDFSSALAQLFEGLIPEKHRKKSGRSETRTQAAPLQWEELNLKLYERPLMEAAKRYGVTLKSLKYASFKPRKTKPLSRVKEQIAFQVVQMQALAALGYVGMDKSRDKGDPQVKILKKEMDGSAVSFGLRMLTELAERFDVRIIVIGNEGAKRDGSAAIEILFDINPEGKEGTLLFVNDAVEGTEYAIKGLPGAWSAIALLDAHNAYSTDDYRATINYRAKRRANIDPVIRGPNTLTKVFGQIAEANDQALADWAKNKHVVLLGKRKRHNDLFEELNNLSRLGLSYEDEENITDGDLVPRTLQASSGALTKDGREVVVIGVGGANEHYMSEIWARLGKVDKSGRKAFVASRFVTHDGLRDDLRNADDFSLLELMNFAEINAKIVERKLPVRIIGPEIDQHLLWPRMLLTIIEDINKYARRIKDKDWLKQVYTREKLSGILTEIREGSGSHETEQFHLYFEQYIQQLKDHLVSQIDTEESVTGEAPVVGAAAITGARAVDFSLYQDELPAISIKQTGATEGEIEVSAFLIDAEGDEFLVRATYETEHLVKTGLAILANNTFYPEGSIFYPRVVAVQKAMDVLRGIDFSTQGEKDVVETLDAQKESLVGFIPDPEKSKVRNRLSMWIDAVRSTYESSDHMRREQVYRVRGKAKQAFLDTAFEVAAKLIGEPTVEMNGERKSLVTRRSEVHSAPTGLSTPQYRRSDGGNGASAEVQRGIPQPSLRGSVPDRAEAISGREIASTTLGLPSRNDEVSRAEVRSSWIKLVFAAILCGAGCAGEAAVRPKVRPTSEQPPIERQDSEAEFRQRMAELDKELEAIRKRPKPQEQRSEGKTLVESLMRPLGGAPSEKGEKAPAVKPNQPPAVPPGLLPNKAEKADDAKPTVRLEFIKGSNSYTLLVRDAKTGDERRRYQIEDKKRVITDLKATVGPKGIEFTYTYKKALPPRQDGVHIEEVWIDGVLQNPPTKNETLTFALPTPQPKASTEKPPLGLIFPDETITIDGDQVERRGGGLIVPQKVPTAKPGPPRSEVRGPLTLEQHLSILDKARDLALAKKKDPKIELLDTTFFDAVADEFETKRQALQRLERNAIPTDADEDWARPRPTEDDEIDSAVFDFYSEAVKALGFARSEARTDAGGIQSRLQELEEALALSPERMGAIAENFRWEMEPSVSDELSSLKMINSLVPRPTGNETGKFLALDLGGTNFRVLLVELEKGKVKEARIHKFVLTPELIQGDRDPFFDFIADRIQQVVSEERLSSETTYPLGFSFAFPVRQTQINRGVLIHWDKDFAVKRVEGEEVVGLLESALEKKGIKNVQIAALVNDTVGTLATVLEAVIGAILGTGTNGAFWGESLAYNTEWGGFNRFPERVMIREDRELDSASTNPGQQILEKMVSGKYLGEVARRLLQSLETTGVFRGREFEKIEKPYALKSEDLTTITGDRSAELVEIGKLFPGSTLAERMIVKRVAELVFVRSARIFVSAVSAIISKIDPKLTQEHTVAIDGSLYEKSEAYQREVEEAAGTLWGGKTVNVKFVLTKDGSGVGAAIVAAIAAASTARSEARTEKKRSEADIETGVVDVISNYLNVAKEKITRRSKLTDDLGADSLDLTELAMKLEDAFDISLPDEEFVKIETVGQAIQAVAEKLHSPARSEARGLGPVPLSINKRSEARKSNARKKSKEFRFTPFELKLVATAPLEYLQVGSVRFKGFGLDISNRRTQREFKRLLNLVGWRNLKGYELPRVVTASVDGEEERVIALIIDKAKSGELRLIDFTGGELGPLYEPLVGSIALNKGRPVFVSSSSRIIPFSALPRLEERGDDSRFFTIHPLTVQKQRKARSEARGEKGKQNPEEILKEVIGVISEDLGKRRGIERERITPETRLREDLGASSLDFIELLMAVEDKFDITIPDKRTGSLRTVHDIVNKVQEIIEVKAARSEARTGERESAAVSGVGIDREGYRRVFSEFLHVLEEGEGSGKTMKEVVAPELVKTSEVAIRELLEQNPAWNVENTDKLLDLLNDAFQKIRPEEKLTLQDLSTLTVSDLGDLIEEAVNTLSEPEASAEVDGLAARWVHFKESVRPELWEIQGKGRERSRHETLGIESRRLRRALVLRINGVVGKIEDSKLGRNSGGRDIVRLLQEAKRGLWKRGHVPKNVIRPIERAFTRYLEESKHRRPRITPGQKPRRAEKDSKRISPSAKRARNDFIRLKNLAAQYPNTFRRSEARSLVRHLMPVSESLTWSAWRATLFPLFQWRKVEEALRQIADVDPRFLRGQIYTIVNKAVERKVSLSSFHRFTLLRFLKNAVTAKIPYPEIQSTFISTYLALLDRSAEETTDLSDILSREIEVKTTGLPATPYQAERAKLIEKLMQQDVDLSQVQWDKVENSAYESIRWFTKDKIRFQVNFTPEMELPETYPFHTFGDGVAIPVDWDPKPIQYVEPQRIEIITISSTDPSTRSEVRRGIPQPSLRGSVPDRAEAISGREIASTTLGLPSRNDEVSRAEVRIMAPAIRPVNLDAYRNPADSSLFLLTKLERDSAGVFIGSNVFYHDGLWVDPEAMYRTFEEGGALGTTTNQSIALKKSGTWKELVREHWKQGLTPEESFLLSYHREARQPYEALAPLRVLYGSIANVSQEASALFTKKEELIRGMQEIDGLFGKRDEGEEQPLVKLPNIQGPAAGLPNLEEDGPQATHDRVRSGRSGNITLGFSVDHYLAHAEKYIEGLDQLIKDMLDKGKEDMQIRQAVSRLTWVFSLFMRRIDALVVPWFDEAIEEATRGGDDARREELELLRGKTSVALGRFVGQVMQTIFFGKELKDDAEFLSVRQREKISQLQMTYNHLHDYYLAPPLNVLIASSARSADQTYATDLQYSLPLLGLGMWNTLPSDAFKALSNFVRVNVRARPLLITQLRNRNLVEEPIPWIKQAAKDDDEVNTKRLGVEWDQAILFSAEERAQRRIETKSASWILKRTEEALLSRRASEKEKSMKAIGDERRDAGARDFAKAENQMLDLIRGWYALEDLGEAQRDLPQPAEDLSELFNLARSSIEEAISTASKTGKYDYAPAVEKINVLLAKVPFLPIQSAKSRLTRSEVRGDERGRSEIELNGYRQVFIQFIQSLEEGGARRRAEGERSEAERVAESLPQLGEISLQELLEGHSEWGLENVGKLLDFLNRAYKKKHPSEKLTAEDLASVSLGELEDTIEEAIGLLKKAEGGRGLGETLERWSRVKERFRAEDWELEKAISGDSDARFVKEEVRKSAKVLWNRIGTTIGIVNKSELGRRDEGQRVSALLQEAKGALRKRNIDKVHQLIVRAWGIASDESKRYARFSSVRQPRRAVKESKQVSSSSKYAKRALTDIKNRAERLQDSIRRSEVRREELAQRINDSIEQLKKEKAHIPGGYELVIHFDGAPAFQTFVETDLSFRAPLVRDIGKEVVEILEKKRVFDSATDFQVSISNGHISIARSEAHSAPTGLSTLQSLKRSASRAEVRSDLTREELDRLLRSPLNLTLVPRQTLAGGLAGKYAIEIEGLTKGDVNNGQFMVRVKLRESERAGRGAVETLKAAEFAFKELLVQTFPKYRVALRYERKESIQVTFVRQAAPPDLSTPRAGGRSEARTVVEPTMGDQSRWIEVVSHPGIGTSRITALFNAFIPTTKISIDGRKIESGTLDLDPRKRYDVAIFHRKGEYRFEIRLSTRSEVRKEKELIEGLRTLLQNKLLYVGAGKRTLKGSKVSVTIEPVKRGLVHLFQIKIKPALQNLKLDLVDSLGKRFLTEPVGTDGSVEFLGINPNENYTLEVVSRSEVRTAKEGEAIVEVPRNPNGMQPHFGEGAKEALLARVAGDGKVRIYLGRAKILAGNRGFQSSSGLAIEGRVVAKKLIAFGYPVAIEVVTYPAEGASQTPPPAFDHDFFLVVNPEVAAPIREFITHLKERLIPFSGEKGPVHHLGRENLDRIAADLLNRRSEVRTGSEMVEDRSILQWTMGGQSLKQILDRIIKEYDIRGFDGYGDPKLYPKQMDETLLVWLGRISGTNQFYSRVHDQTVGLEVGDTVVVAGDNGPSTDELVKKNLIEGLRDTGVNVIDLGTTVSGHLYKSIKNLGVKGGFYVTRSHVEVGTNGIKPNIGGITLYGEMLEGMKPQILEKASYRKAKMRGMFKAYDIRGEYPTQSRKLYDDSFRREFGGLKELLKAANMKVAVNLNGGAATFYPDLIKEIVGEENLVALLKTESDTWSKNGLADPSRADDVALSHPKANIVQWSKEHPEIPVFNFDLDTDRVSILWAGNLYLGDEEFYPIIEYMLTLDLYKDLNKEFYFDSRMKSEFAELVEHFGGIAKLHPKGHSKVKATMDVMLRNLAREKGFANVQEFLAAHPGFKIAQAEYSLHMFLTNARGESFDDAIEFLFFWLKAFSKIKERHGRPNWTLPEYIRYLKDQKLVRESIQLKEMRTGMPEDAKKAHMIEMKDQMLAFFKGRDDFEYIDSWRDFVGRKKTYTLVNNDGVFHLFTPAGDFYWGWSNTSPKVAFGAQAPSPERLKQLTDIVAALFIHSRSKVGERLQLSLPVIDPKETDQLMKMFGVNTGQALEEIMLRIHPTIESAFQSLTRSELRSKEEDPDWILRELVRAARGIRREKTPEARAHRAADFLDSLPKITSVLDPKIAEKVRENYDLYGTAFDTVQAQFSVDKKEPEALVKKRRKLLGEVSPKSGSLRTNVLGNLKAIMDNRSASRAEARNEVPKKRILVVEDESVTRRSWQERLIQGGYEVVTAEDGEKGLIKFKEAKDKSPFDAVTTDLTMPRKNGDELIRELRQLRPDLPILVVSTGIKTNGETRPVSAVAEELGVSFLEKPAPLDVYLAKVKELLPNFRSEARQTEEIPELAREILESRGLVTVASEQRFQLLPERIRVEKGQDLFAAVVRLFLGEEAFASAARNDERFTQAKSILGIGSKTAYAYILDPEFAFDKGGLGFVGTVFGRSPAAVIVRNRGDHAFVEEFNREHGTNILVAGNVKEAQRELRKWIADLGGTRLRGFVFHGIAIPGGAYADALRYALPNQVTLMTPGLFERFSEAAGVADLVAQLKTRFLLARSA